jgi:excisionase family DNA binding protein
MEKNFKIAEASRMLDVSQVTLRRMIKARRISCYRIGNGAKRPRIRLGLDHLKSYLESVEIGSSHLV